jgi:hypothetical protein
MARKIYSSGGRATLERIAQLVPLASLLELGLEVAGFVLVSERLGRKRNEWGVWSAAEKNTLGVGLLRILASANLPV